MVAARVGESMTSKGGGGTGVTTAFLLDLVCLTGLLGGTLVPEA